MLLLLKILATVAPFIFAIYLSSLKLPTKTKIIVWIICLFISSLIVTYFVKEEVEKKDGIKTERYYQNLIERQELFSRGLPKAYINGLGDHPLLKDFLNRGFSYIKDYKYKEAVKEFEECLTHPKATESEKVAAHIEIGICYYGLSELREAEKHFRKGACPSNS
jgi:tetratricopeptide (TPR) repeat protein